MSTGIHISPMHAWFNVRKAAQVAAFFAHKAGGSINLLKLVKLAYLANREAMSRFDFPIFDDQMVSMPHGPVDSFLLNYIDGAERDRKDWEEFVSDRSNHRVGVASSGICIDDLDELSDADLCVLSDVWQKFGPMDQWALVDHTHAHCAEWEDPDGSSYAIPYSRVFKALGKTRHAELEQQVLQQRALTAKLHAN